MKIYDPETGRYRDAKIGKKGTFTLSEEEAKRIENWAEERRKEEVKRFSEWVKNQNTDKWFGTYADDEELKRRTAEKAKKLLQSGNQKQRKE